MQKHSEVRGHSIVTAREQSDKELSKPPPLQGLRPLRAAENLKPETLIRELQLPNASAGADTRDPGDGRRRDPAARHAHTVSGVQSDSITAVRSRVQEAHLQGVPTVFN